LGTNEWLRLPAYGLRSGDFVLSAETEWDLRADRPTGRIPVADSSSGSTQKGDHYLAYLGLDGWFYFYRNLTGTVKLLGRWYYDQVDIPTGRAKIGIAVEGARMTFFVDDQEVEHFQDETFQTGLLGYALASGTNKDFGTRCRMTNVEFGK
jgi:hypothetical protein